MKLRVLFVNHATEECGVYQDGKRQSAALQEYVNDFEMHYVECTGIHDYVLAIQRVFPAAIIYNYYPSTLPWISPPLLRSFDKIKHIGIFHEVPLPPGMPYKVLLDPSATTETPVFTLEPHKTFKVRRCLFDAPPPQALNPDAFQIGTFGFGFGNKGYVDIVKRAAQEFPTENVVVRLHVPFAKFGDPHGVQAMQQVELCRQAAEDTSVSIEADHDFIPTEDLLKWLASNHMNCFFYDYMYGRGVSGVIDYALSARRPIAVTDSYMFRHIADADPSVCISSRSLKEIYETGFAPLQKYVDEWTPKALASDYENILHEVLNA